MPGHELADERGSVLAEAELAWPQHRVAVLLPDQEDLSGVWSKAGWRIVLVGLELDAEQSAEWAVRVLEMTSKGMLQ